MVAPSSVRATDGPPAPTPGAAPTGDPAALTPAVVGALLRAVVWQLGGGLWVGRRRGRRWRRRAAAIVDPGVRAETLDALDGKRPFVDGAALLWTLADRPNPGLAALLADFQVAANLVDHAGERGVAVRGLTSTTLTGALEDAVDPDARGRDPYADHPWDGDDGLLAALVAACREGCVTLRGFGPARELLVHEARLVQALELTHHPDATARQATLRRFVDAAHPRREDTGLRWFELAAGDASAMTVLASLALAADGGLSDADRVAAVHAYRWVAALSTMLDSYVDRDDDEASGDWCALAPYGDRDDAIAGLAGLVERTLREVGALRNGPRHVVVVAAMTAMFLADHDASPDGRLLRAGGALTRVLVPVLRAWRALSAPSRRP